MISARSGSKIPDPFKVLLQGVPARSNRGWFGYCTVTLFRLERRWALFDTGQYCDRDELYKALKAVDVKPEQIRFVVLSHLHFDHILNLPMFPNATVFVSKREIDHAENVMAGRSQDTAIVDLWSTLIEDHPIELVVDRMQIDKELSLKVLPGHTPGCLALFCSCSTNTAVCGDILKNGWETITRQPFSKDCHALQARAGSPARSGWFFAVFPGCRKKETPAASP